MADMESSDAASNSSWVKKLWPVQKFELKKVVPLLILKFLASIVFQTLTCMKDSLVVTATGSGAEVIPVLKGWVVFPLSLLSVIFYSKLSNHYKRSTLFYSIVAFFLIIIFLYGFVLFPNADALSPHASSNWLTIKFGAKYTHWISVYRNWIHSLFFVTSELWGQFVICILYWSFANHICKIKEAKRMYNLFIAAGDLAIIFSGPMIMYYVSKFSTGDFASTLKSLLSYVLLAGLGIIATYWWMNKYVLTDKRYYDSAQTKQTLNQKTKLTLSKSIKHIFSSKYLLSIAVLVIGCALTINMVEVTWKAHVKILFPDTGDYMVFISKVTTFVGVVALITVLFLGGNFLRYFGWNFSAQITPLVLGFTGIMFFLLSYFKDSLGPFAAIFGTTPLVLLVLVGAFQNIASKVVKYSFFDSTKEMAYIPLDPESKVKGKAAIDMVGSRLGKSSSSWLQVGLMQLAGTSSVLLITPYLIPIVLGATLYWSYSVKYLNKELTEKEASLASKEREEKERAPSTKQPTPA